MRRLLLGADVLGVAVALALTEFVFGDRSALHLVSFQSYVAFFVLTVAIWILGAKIFGLYDRDEEKTDYSTTDDLVRVFLLATVGIFLLTRGLLLTHLADPDLTQLTVFWLSLIVCVPAARIATRTIARTRPAYVQNTVIVGSDGIGQLVARKLLLHREYGINLLGFVDDNPGKPRLSFNGLPLLGALDDLSRLVRDLHVDRVVIAFPDSAYDELIRRIRSLRDAGVQVDIVPRLFETIGPKHNVHAVEGVPLIGLAPVRPQRFSRLLKRSFDVLGAAFGLLLVAPLMALIAVLVKLDSPGPVLFRQTRLGEGMHAFTLLKFRTMEVGADDSVHREFVAALMSWNAPVDESGCFKLERAAEISRVGRWLRKTSIDELPQLWNVLRGEMSLVGPRPCLPYELELFAPHHLDRFLVPAGLTGLWQVSARAHSTFGEALDLDVLYAQSWSFGLDVALLAKTPIQLLRTDGTR